MELLPWPGTHTAAITTSATTWPVTPRTPLTCPLSSPSTWDRGDLSPLLGLFTLQVVSTLLQQAGPGQTHERTLLLVFGDHGQTLTGEHGGGTPPETDSALLAVHLGALHALRRGGAASR